MVRKVLILDRIPRFDTPSTDPFNLKNKLSDYGNEILREERDKTDVKDHIFISPHSLPNQFQENLYGHPNSSYFDGIHLRGPDGNNHYTRSLCNILQTFLCDHSREFHNHTIPRIHKTPVSPSFSPTSPPSKIPTSSVSHPLKPDSVAIQIEDDDLFTYSIPTYNSFSALGNCLPPTTVQSANKHYLK